MKKKKNQWRWYQAKYEMSEFIIEKLKNYQKNFNKDGYAIPTWLLSGSEKKYSYSEHEIERLKKDWNKEINLMINSFQQVLDYDLLGGNYNEEEIQKGLDSFSKHFLHFWD